MSTDLDEIPEADENIVVVCNVIGAWETWGVAVPAGTSDEWIRDNLALCEKWLIDSGADSYVVDEVIRD